MKTACLILAMISCAVLIHATSYALSPTPAPQEQSSESSTTSSDSAHPMDAASAENRKRQKVGTHSDRTRSHISHKNHSPSRVSLTKANRPRELRNGHEPSTPKNVINVHQPSSSKPAGDAKITNHRTPPVRTAGITALSGQQFRNPHNRAASMATIGGPLDPTRNTAAINGTSINRRHVN